MARAPVRLPSVIWVWLTAGRPLNILLDCTDNTFLNREEELDVALDMDTMALEVAIICI